MADETENTVLRDLRHIDGRVGQLGKDLIQMRSEMTLLRNDTVLIHHRIDRAELRLERIEKRPDLTSA
jgi:hypothetical protein